MDDRWPAAARNNAEWCDAVARSHGVVGRFEPEAWTSRAPTPPLYPEAVTLVPDPSIPDLVSRIDVVPGCSIKDSFASIDLTAHGFEVLFDAQWIVRARPAPSEGRRFDDGLEWAVLDHPEELAAWEEAWRHDGDPVGQFRPALLDHDEIAVLAGRRGDRTVAGAILNVGAGVVGISNVFDRTGRAEAESVWGGALGLADSLFPGVPVVGYESGDSLDAARAQGFEAAGRLRVWMYYGPASSSRSSRPASPSHWPAETPARRRARTCRCGDGDAE